MDVENQFKNFHKDFIIEKKKSNIKVISVFVNKELFEYINKVEDFNLANQNYYQKDNGFKGFYKNIKLYQDSKKEYDIETEELYKVCGDCSQRKMYDEKYEKYYCPMCDSRIDRFKDKIYKIVE